MSPETLAKQPRIILHLDQSRSGGHLLQRILSEQPRRRFLDHPFSQARGKQVQWLLGSAGAVADEVKEIEDGLRKEWEAAMAKGREMLDKAVQEAGEQVRRCCFSLA